MAVSGEAVEPPRTLPQQIPLAHRPTNRLNLPLVGARGPSAGAVGVCDISQIISKVVVAAL